MLIMAVVFFSNQAVRPYTFVMSGIVLALMGWINGYTTARLIKFFGGQDWICSAFLSSCVFPSWLTFQFMIIDVIEWDAESAESVPYSAALGMISGFLLLTIPLSMHGSYTGFCYKNAPTPKVNLVRRNIPAQPWFIHSTFTLPIFGLIIFASIYVEFSYFLSSMWHSYTIYAMFGFLFINIILTSIVVGLLSTIQTYFMFTFGDY